MRLFRLLIVLSFIFVLPVKAQYKLALDEAVNLAYQNNIELQKQYSRIKNTEAVLGETTRLPNPVFSYTREDLNNASFDYNEWIASGSIPLNFLWNRWSNIESKEKSLEAQKLLYENLKLNISAQVRENYFVFYKYSELSEKLNRALVRLTELSESAKHRLNEGDISGYELQRMLIEVNKIQSAASDIALLKNKFENNLKLLIGFNAADKFSTEPIHLKKETDFSEEQLLNNALNNRNDLKSFEKLIESENLFLTHNQMKVIPNISLSAGYKKQSDNLKGTVFAVDFEVPLFNRNQTAIEQSEIRINLLEKELSFLKEKIKTEVYEAHHNYSVNKTLYEKRNDILLNDIFNTAAYSYGQGEISLVEFIDGINAFIDGSILSSELEINLQKSFYRLEKAAGISLTNFEK